MGRGGRAVSKLRQGCGEEGVVRVIGRGSLLND
jgi:hypothetical protein